MNIVLVGMSGSGKSVVSIALASKLGINAVDTDAVIVERYGNISKIFADYGEEYFRKIETCIVKSIALYNNTVIATGGGTLINPQNMAALRTNGKIIYLNTDIAEIVKRLKGDTSRPLLEGDLETKINEQYSQRKHIYEASADYVVQTDGLTPDQIAEKIVELLK